MFVLGHEFQSDDTQNRPPVGIKCINGERKIASLNCKKRYHEDENRNFKPEREQDFAFTKTDQTSVSYSPCDSHYKVTTDITSLTKEKNARIKEKQVICAVL
ncbi:Hypothetical predicted protein [Octopus vulgaris]|uniref:Uncharacterized protein n=1 Tax=Octopus vulgaris TaxID=6645 RepID=A0AA36B381_OCTVU|nr:Hypothetical predicted protein [Octopus vulgaris]